MRRGLRSIPAVLMTAAVLFVSGIAAQAGPVNLVELHRNAGALSKKECLSCHAGIMKDTSLARKIKTFHRLHLESKKDTPKNCSDCHKSVDLREGSAAALRKQVDPGLCAECHGGGAGARILFAR